MKFITAATNLKLLSIVFALAASNVVNADGISSSFLEQIDVAAKETGALENSSLRGSSSSSIGNDGADVEAGEGVGFCTRIGLPCDANSHCCSSVCNYGTCGGSKPDNAPLTCFPADSWCAPNDPNIPPCCNALECKWGEYYNTCQ